MNANSSIANKTGLYLITGTSGTGKSTVCSILEQKGIRTVDGDSIARWVNCETGMIPQETYPTNAAWVHKHFWEWNSAKIKNLYDEAEKELIVLAGSADHMDTYWPLFRRVFLLELSADETKERVLSRDTHDYGKGEGQLEVILAWKKELSDIAEANGVIRIDASPAPEIVTNSILEQL